MEIHKTHQSTGDLKAISYKEEEANSSQKMTKDVKYKQELFV